MFDDDKLYLTDDPALRVLGPYSTLAHWRSEGRGPAYVKLGTRIASKSGRSRVSQGRCRVSVGRAFPLVAGSKLPVSR